MQPVTRRCGRRRYRSGSWCARPVNPGMDACSIGFGESAFLRFGIVRRVLYRLTGRSCASDYAAVAGPEYLAVMD
jgi:hypothetical protein